MMFDLEYMERYSMSAEDYDKEPWDKIWLSQLKWHYQDERRKWDEQKQSV